MDKELFELCKEVVERTEWGGTDYFYCSGNVIHRTQLDDDDFLGEVIPLYTSDYLLEKLPRIITDHYYLTITPSKQHWYAAYSQYAMGKEVKFNNQADTPLKALLKLTIALNDAGELKS